MSSGHAPARSPSVDTPPAASPEQNERPATCAAVDVPASEVVFIGESFVAVTHATPTMLTQRARDAGAIGAEESYRDVSVAGTELANGGIERQYERAAAAGRIGVVLISAGASDLALAGRCQTGADDRCMEVVSATRRLLDRMAQDGVHDALLTFYPDPRGVGERLKQPLDALRPEMQRLCEQQAGALRCHWLDLRPTWNDHPEYSIDGLYPSIAGSRASADAIWQSMLQHCLAS
jgi:hypothetical protein